VEKNSREIQWRNGVMGTSGLMQFIIVDLSLISYCWSARLLLFINLITNDSSTH